jgi:hypothetical protein
VEEEFKARNFFYSNGSRGNRYPVLCPPDLGQRSGFGKYIWPEEDEDIAQYAGPTYNYAGKLWTEEANALPHTKLDSWSGRYVLGLPAKQLGKANRESFEKGWASQVFHDRDGNLYLAPQHTVLVPVPEKRGLHRDYASA